MPQRPNRPCKQPGCPGLVESGYCDQHSKQATKDRRLYDAARGSAHKRGYDREWKKWRLGFLRKFPLCKDCDNVGLIRIATEVHHRLKVQDHPELQFIEGNCMPLCKSCHSKRTKRGE